jgi:hypothetical protein
VHPAAGLGIVEETLTLISATADAPDGADIRAIYAKYDSEEIEPDYDPHRSRSSALRPRAHVCCVSVTVALPANNLRHDAVAAASR